MKFVCYKAWDELPAGAADLFALSAARSVFFSRPWFETLATHSLGEHRSLLLAGVIVDDALQALLPLARQGDGSLLALSHNYTPAYNILLTQHDQPAVLACLAQGLAQLPARSVQLAPVDPADTDVEHLQRVFSASGFTCHEGFRFYNWIHPVGGRSFAEYLAGRPARLRNTIVRKQRKLAREHGYDIKLYSGRDVPAAMPDYYTSYNASWKATEQYHALLDGLVARFSSAGWTRLAVLYVENRPVAAQLWFVAHGKASIFRLAYDEAWKAYSPGSILTAYLMEHVIDVEQVGEIDFLNGNEVYKQDWMSLRRERWSLVLANESSGPQGRGFWQGLLQRSGLRKAH